MKKNLWTKIGVAALALVLVVVSLVGIRAMSNTGSGSGSSGSSSASRPATLTNKSGTTVYQNGTALDRLDLDELTAESNGTTVYVDGEAVPEFDVDEYSAEIEEALDDKADKSSTYTKTEVDTALGGKADYVLHHNCFEAGYHFDSDVFGNSYSYIKVGNTVITEQQLIALLHCRRLSISNQLFVPVALPQYNHTAR